MAERLYKSDVKPETRRGNPLKFAVMAAVHGGMQSLKMNFDFYHRIHIKVFHFGM